MAIRSVEESMTGQVKQGESVCSVSFIKRMSREIFNEQMKLNKARGWAMKLWRKIIPGSGNSKCKALRQGQPAVFEDLQERFLFIIL